MIDETTLRDIEQFGGGTERALVMQIRELVAALEGKTAAPTDAEIDAHVATGGTWRSVVRGEWVLSCDGADAKEARETREVQSANAQIVARAGVRWWKLDAEGRLVVRR